ncbi:hypothetical protein EVAR_30917_1 [Eumeta japonica]|uniref:PX domain-containing protein n=1 Tax=Eumeta variegata TaxID=151549 RepID=A0A4C1V3E7_EUMVA|nr:hypothetical protein EVAR_30917_1 [Eumeta japonica]
MPETRKRFLRSCTALSLSLSSRLCLTTVTTQYAFITHRECTHFCSLANRVIIMASTSAGTNLSTRNKTDIWLIGQPSPQLVQSKLPTIIEVLRVFFYYKNEEKKSVRDSANSTSCDVLALWTKAGIPTRIKKHVIAKIENYYKQWANLKKNKENKKKRSETLKNKEQVWKNKLLHLFDIAHTRALDMITIEEDKQFLIAQRQKDRKGQIGAVDKASL